jgi:predicted alpha/beta-hydrolase family hydrolase
VPEERLLPTPQGHARVHIRRARPARLALMLQHGASGGIGARDLVALATRLPEHGITTIVLQQPFAVAGKRVAPRPAVLDECLAAVVRQLRLRTPLVLGGRSSGARCSCRMARELGAVAALALAFPLHPPGRPEKSRADELLGSGVPTLVVQGTRDTFGGPDEFPALPSGTRLVDVPGGDHGFAVTKASHRSQAETVDDLVAAVLVWLDEVAGNLR